MLQHTSDEYTDALSAAVSARDLPRAALCAKELLRRRAHVKLRTGIINGLGLAADVDERYAQSVCEILSELRSCDTCIAASALTTCMKSVSTKTLRRTHKCSTVLINSAAVDRAIATTGCDEDMANVMANTLGGIETAAAFAEACARNGRDPSALKALAKCTFLKNKDFAEGTRKLLLACVRASRTKRSDIFKVCVNVSLERALTTTLTTGAACDDSDGAEAELKMAAIWTFVPKRTAATMYLEKACSAVTSAEDMKIITGFRAPEISTKVTMMGSPP